MDQFCAQLINNIRDVLDISIAAASSPLLWAGAALGVVGTVVVYLIRRRSGDVSVTLNLPFGLGNVTYQATELNRVLAWKMYVQLKTRKAALPLDEDNDVIADVYDSLHELFPITRELLNSTHLGEMNKHRGVADLILRVQNDGLRPHLTTWQASFRRWWEQALASPENAVKSPQEIQRQYPKYEELVNDLKRMNGELNKYAEDLLEIVEATKNRKRVEPRIVTHPIAPTSESRSEQIQGPAAETRTVEEKSNDNPERM